MTINLHEMAQSLRQHPFLTSLEIARTLIRIQQHQRRGFNGRQGPQLGKICALLGIAPDVFMRERERASYSVETAYRAACGGGAVSGRKKYRYVVEDENKHSMIVEY